MKLFLYGIAIVAMVISKGVTDYYWENKTTEPIAWLVLALIIFGVMFVGIMLILSFLYPY